VKVEAMILAGAVLATSLASFAATPKSVTVIFRDPSSYTDAGPYAKVDPAEDLALVEIERHVQRLGLRYLPPGQALRVEFLGIDLAGRLEPWHPYAADLRVMRDVTWPRMRFRYFLEHDGVVVESGEERLVDLEYLVTPTAYLSQDPLRFDKRLLDNWFARRFEKRSESSPR
jgi:hypothetical protein